MLGRAPAGSLRDGAVPSAVLSRERRKQAVRQQCRQNFSKTGEKTATVYDQAGEEGRLIMGATIGKESLVSSLVSLGSSGGHHCVMIGLDSSGKTTILYRLKHGQYTNTAPTIGFNCEKVRESSSRHGMASHLCLEKRY